MQLALVMETRNMAVSTRRQRQNARKASTGIPGHVGGDRGSTVSGDAQNGQCARTVAEWMRVAKTQPPQLRNAIRAACVGKWDDEVVTATPAFVAALREEQAS